MGAFKNEKNGTWYVQFRYTDWQGLRQQKLKRGFATKREAQAWERVFLMQKQADVNMSFESFVALYEKDVKPKLKLNTWLSKEHIIRTKILPYFKKRKLSEITARDVIDWQNEIRQHTKSNGESYSPDYLKNVHTQLSCIFNHAIKYYGLQINPAAKAGNMGSEQPKEMLFWTKEEYLKFIDAMMDKPMLYYAFEVLYWCGIREGELLALTPTDFDFEKKTAAPDTSVGADDGQSVSKNSDISITTFKEEINDEVVNPQESLEEMYRKIQRMSDPAYLHTVTLDELMDNVFEVKSAVIENLLYTGAYILAGAPKIGKSFLVAQIAHHVSTGQDLWGYKVHQGTVLYLALEDDESHLQRRMFRMFGVEGTSSLHFATSAKMIGSGLDEQLEKFVREHSDPKLIIVDTLQKVREMVSDNYSYSSDYEVIGKLKQFADRHGVCILIVHHTRKQPAGDSFEKISGITGLSGCADGSLIMQKEKRTDGKATLEISGRDQPDQRLYLSKDQERLVWLLDHAENELWKQPPDPVLEAVAKIVSDENREWEGSPTELTEALRLDMAVNRLTKHLNVNASRLLEEHQVKYENKTKHAGRRIRLTYMVEAPMVEVIK